ncbi:c-type cytochrome [Rhodocytophaga rosea]|uniref:C-type cytochrome n=1 Tax=Rhodocytophaga rosea TaxID=2704465 RepID=A0A6C0GM60_9BACT|nr:PVC-type heme-binding CxxCH protein [Rhodocytophaga rosea]QHT69115.1 c-type cytochrome [Rhodocytophaga rosea]
MCTITKKLFFLALSLILAQACVKPQKTADSASPLSTTQASNPATDYLPVKPDTIYAEHVRTSEFRTPEQERLQFILPPDFEVTLFASEPDITKPINMAFDEKGRLWVTQSSEYPIEAGPSEGSDRITVLEDTNGDGKADKIQDFASDLNIPIGIMPVKGGAIAYSIPNVYRLYDTDNDGKADKRKVMLGAFGHKDTHGMVNNLVRGFDGWIHASHGFANTSLIAGTDGDSIKMFSGNTFRFRLDGSRVEKTTDGRINPFGSAFDEMGYHYSADCHTLPIYQLIWGGDYTQWGKRERSMGFAPTMMDYDLNSTALAGLVYYTDTHFPAEYQHSFYSGDVVTCRISRNIMTFNGSTPKATRKQDFLVSKDPWFRPVDIKVGPDGALYIADFYNRIIGHYEVPLNHPGRDRISGRIWKITYKGNKLSPILDFSSMSQEELLNALSNEVLQTRMKATDALVDRFGKQAIPALQKHIRTKNIATNGLIQSLWALYRLNGLPEPILVSAIKHTDVRVKVHAFKIAANHNKLTDPLRTLAMQSLDDSNPHVQRAAAEVLGRHPSEQNLSKLVSLASKVPAYDTHLRYTVLLSIKNHLQREGIMQQVAREKWDEQSAGIIAMIAADMQSWEAGRYLFTYLKTYNYPKERFPVYIESVTRNMPASEIDEVIDFVKNKTGSYLEDHYPLAKAVNAGIEQRGGKSNEIEALRKWNTGLATHFLLQVPDNNQSLSKELKERLVYAAQMAELYKEDSLLPELRKLFAFRNAGDETRHAAAEALISIAPEHYAIWIANTLDDNEETIAMRQRMARTLAQSKLPKVRSLLVRNMKTAPYEVQETIAGLLVSDTTGKPQLIKLIRQGEAPARVLKSRNVEDLFLAGIQPEQKKEFDQLTAGILPISEERQKLIEKRIAEFTPAGKTADMGKAIFIKNCSMCHQIDKTGGLIGPQLDGIGNWGRHSLTTKILDPNRNITENFRMYNITLKNGKMVSGLYRRDEGQSLVLADVSGKEFSIPQQNIQEKVASPYTLMPDHFSTTISKEDFDALLVFLLQEK